MSEELTLEQQLEINRDVEGFYFLQQLILNTFRNFPQVRLFPCPEKYSMYLNSMKRTLEIAEILRELGEYLGNNFRTKAFDLSKRLKYFDESIKRDYENLNAV